MSLAQRFDEFGKEAGKDGQRLFGFEDLQRAFYAGAEAGLYEAKEIEEQASPELAEQLIAEIDHFRSHK